MYFRLLHLKFHLYLFVSFFFSYVQWYYFRKDSLLFRTISIFRVIYLAQRDFKHENYYSSDFISDFHFIALHFSIIINNLFLWKILPTFAFPYFILMLSVLQHFHSENHGFNASHCSSYCFDHLWAKKHNYSTQTYAASYVHLPLIKNLLLIFQKAFAICCITILLWDWV